MTIRALCTGTLYGDPESRTGASGKGYTRAKLRADVSKDEPAVWVSLIAFGSQADTLAYLKAGDSVSVSGKCKLTAWTDKQGNPQPGVDLVVDELISLKAKSKIPIIRAAPPAVPAGDDFDDDIPF